MSGTLPTRSELDPAYTWDLTPLYATEESFRADLERLATEAQTVASYRGRLGESAATLSEFLELKLGLDATLQRLNNYATLPVSVDQSDREARKRAGEFRALQAQVGQQLAFVRPELLSLGSEKLEAFMREEPNLVYLERYFEMLETQRPHVRSPEVEELLQGLGDSFGALQRAYNSLANGEIRFDPVRVDGEEFIVERSTYPTLKGSRNRAVREAAYRSYKEGFLGFSDTLTELYLGRVKQALFNSRARSYEDTLAQELEPYEVPRSVLEAVLDTFTANLPVWHRYWAARKKLLGVDRLEEWDVFAPLSAEPMVVPYSRSIEWVLDGMAPLGEAYVGPLRRGLERERWVDVYPNRGKRDGAFCSHAYGFQPQVMMSYTDDLGSLSTLAHELGHAMHDVLMDASQPIAYTDVSMVAAETASNFNQALVRKHLLSRFTEPAQRLDVLDEAFGNFHRYFFIMPTLVRFELFVHEAVARGEGLTADQLNRKMRELFAEGYGGEIEVDERVGITWAEFGHLYVPFYTFQYAAGIAAAAALAEDVFEGEPGSVERYIGFLRAGNSVPAIDALRAAGVDLSTPEPIERAFAVLERHVGELEGLA
ncbi:MAG TPA: M3 family oligoendopeptidase [Trueperaceae bacterium]|nr:M3 family oligoendopeptidase [Trueperaceae bacterium]